MSIQTADTLKFAEVGRLSPIADELDYGAIEGAIREGLASESSRAIVDSSGPGFPSRQNRFQHSVRRGSR